MVLRSCPTRSIVKVTEVVIVSLSCTDTSVGLKITSGPAVECMSAHHPWTCMDMHVECMSAHHPWTCMDMHVECMSAHHPWTCMDMHGPNQTTCLHALPANRVCLVLWHANACLSLSTWLGLDWLHNKQLSSLASRQCYETFVCLYVILQITTQYQ